MIRIINKSEQAYGAFNGGEIVENKPLGFPREGGATKAYSSLFYWANAIAKKDSTIGLHPHQGFEIMSFVLDGEIKHFDTKANEWKPLQKGDAQIIRSGNGISHSEFMGRRSSKNTKWRTPANDGIFWSWGGSYLSSVARNTMAPHFSLATPSIAVQSTNRLVLPLA